jgi:signal peptidase I
MASRRLVRRIGRAAVTFALGLGALACLAVAAAIVLLHFSIHTVLSPSMKPTYGPGWAIVVRPEPVTAVKPGQILMFTPPGESAPFAHRVETVAFIDGHPVLTTKGDANPVADPWHAELNNRTAYHVVAEVPWLGTLMTGSARLWRVLALALAGIAFCWTGTRAIIRHSDPSKPLTA